MEKTNQTNYLQGGVFDGEDPMLFSMPALEKAIKVATGETQSFLCGVYYARLSIVAAGGQL